MRRDFHDNGCMTTTLNPATDKQLAYAASLLDAKGFGARWMTAKHASLGASMRQRSGTVEAWLRSMSRSEISALITRLQGA